MGPGLEPGRGDLGPGPGGCPAFGIAPGAARDGMIRAEIGHNFEDSYVSAPAGEPNDVFVRRHFERAGFCTSMGRVAIELVCQHLGLGAEDEVFVTTTFGAHYVSSVVTCSIFNYCRPSKVFTERTRLIYVIHEFGVPHPDTRALAETARERNLVLLEDCAYCVDSWHQAGVPVGAYGDYVVYSLPKVYEIPYGGILLGDVPRSLYRPSRRERRMLEKIEFALARHVPRSREIGATRRANWDYLLKGLHRIGLQPCFDLPDLAAPYCLPVTVPERRDEVLASVGAAGYEAFAWRGGEIAVLPVHQGLAPVDLEQMLTAVDQALRA